MNLKQLWRILMARRSIVLSTALACLFAAILAGVLIPARYKATSRVMLDVVKPDPVTGQVVASQFARTYVQTQTELIRDYRVAGKVVDALGWISSPELAAEYAKRSSGDDRDLRRWIAQRLIDNTRANVLEGSNILEISFIAPDPQVAAKVADTLRQAYVDQTIAFKRDDALEDGRWFRRQVDSVRDELTAAEDRKSTFEKANGIVIGDDNIDEESRRLSALASSSPQVSAPSISMGGGNPMAGQLAQANAAIANAERTLGPNNPDLISMKQQRDAIAAAGRASGGRSIVRGGGGPSLTAMYGSQVTKVLAQRGKVDEARKLAVDVSVLRDQYQKTLAKAADLDQQAASTDSGLTFLGNATAPQTAIWPRWWLILFGSLALGLAIGTLAALMTELARPRVRGLEDLDFPDVPVIGIMNPPLRATRRRVADRRWRKAEAA
jgi:succinoglycan biosynthesis transport protein ExoP